MEKKQKAEQTHMRPFAAFNTFINVLMASGPILLPVQVAAAGYGYSVICLILCCIISMIACDFIIEALSIANYKTAQEGSISQAINTNVNVSASDMDEANHVIPKFHLKDQFEYGSMSYLFYGKKMEVFSVAIIVIYLYGAMISKGIMVGKSLSAVFSGTQIVQEFYFWVLIFFFLSAVLSFKDVASISIVQTLVALVRYVTIISMVVGAAQIMIKYQTIEQMTWFNSSSLPQLISTAIFAYLMHHSSPGMLRPVRPQSKIRTIIMGSFSFGLIVFLLIPLTGIWAFPGLGKYCLYNIVFDQSPVKWAYYIISFYMFLNIAALPVLTITIRKNLMKLLVPHLLPKNSFQITKASIAFTLLISIPCTLLTIVLQDSIEIVVGLTGGLCGVFILLILPALLVWKGRKICPESRKHNQFQSIFKQDIYIYILLLLGIIFIPYNLFLQIRKLLVKSASCLDEFDPTITHY